MDLTIAPGPGVVGGLTIPGSELTERFSRSPGPGGQSVNTADSRVELEFDVGASGSLTEVRRARLMSRLGPKLVDGRLVVACSEYRSQYRNRVAARERLGALLRAALAPPPPARRATKPTRGSRERRLGAKRQRAQTKATRHRPEAE